MSIHAFRNALDGLVAATERRSKRNPGRARRNMAIRMSPSGEITADTPEELIAYQRLSSRSGAGRQPERSQEVRVRQEVRETRAPRREARAPRREARKADKPSKPQREPRATRTAGDAPSYGQGKAIGNSIGGFENYCPRMAEQLKAQQVSHAQVLFDMGLTFDTASEVIAALKAEGLLGFNRDKLSMRKAQAILESVGGVSCPV